MGALLGPPLVPVITRLADSSAAFSLFAVSLMAGALAVMIFGPETKGRVLEDIAR